VHFTLEVDAREVVKVAGPELIIICRPTCHSKTGFGPPLIGEAVKLILSPAQMAVLLAVNEIVGCTVGVDFTTNGLLITVSF
jgi:hypothetical protein